MKRKPDFDDKELEKEEERKKLEAELSSKYDVPTYLRKEVHNYLKPFIFTEQSERDKDGFLSDKRLNTHERQFEMHKYEQMKKKE